MCQELTYEVINCIALSGAIASAPPEREPKRLRAYRILIANVSKTPNRTGCLIKDRILLKLLVETNSTSSKFSSITPISE